VTDTDEKVAHGHKGGREESQDEVSA
jgi:hypothetical protein